MTPPAEQLEARLRHVLDDAANQLHVDTPSPRSVEMAARSTGGARRRRAGVRRLELPSLGAVLAATAVLATAGIALAAVVLLGHRRAASPPTPAISQPASGIDGSTSALLARVRSLRGEPIVVTVWASWCQPCRRQAGLIARAAERYGQHVAFLGVAAGDTRSAAASFLRTHPLGFPTYMSTLDLRPLLPHALAGIPVTLYLGPDGKPVAKHDGEYVSFASLAHDIDAFSLHGGSDQQGVPSARRSGESAAIRGTAPSGPSPAGRAR